MNLKAQGARDHPAAAISATAQPDSDAEHCLSILADGAARQVPSFDGEEYKIFQAAIARLLVYAPDQLSSAEKLSIVRRILREFEHSREITEKIVRDRQSSWRALSLLLLSELLTSRGIEAESDRAEELKRKIGGLSTREQLDAFREQVEAFLHPAESPATGFEVSPLKRADRSTENDYATGLLGSGSAVEHMRKILDRGGRGFVVLFRLGNLEMIGERLGLDAAHNSLIAVSAAITQSLRSSDSVYHWSDSALLVILQGRLNEQVLQSELRRVAARNSGIALKIGDRVIMVRVQLEFQLHPISRFHTAEELCNLIPEPAAAS